MALMIPSYISKDVKSNAERKIFEELKENEGTENWIVLHSLSLAKHEKLLLGEIDFLILAPGLGVFAIEVKGGRVSSKNGIWEFTNRYGQTNTKTRSPFAQAAEGMYAVKKYIEDNGNSQFQNLMYGFGVVFSDIDFDESSIEYERWQYADKHDIDLKGIDKFIINLAKNNKQKWIDKYNNWSEDKVPDKRKLKKIADLLRGNFDRPILIRDEIDEIDKTLFKLTREQFSIIDAAEDNARILVNGAAGTGKTVLAIKEAVRSSSNGEKTGVFCFNTTLGNYFKSHPDLKDNENIIYSGSIHSYLLSQIKNSSLESLIDFENPKFFSETMPDLAMKIMQNTPVFDRIIIDEAQDMLNEYYISFFDSALKGGFSRGKWAIFGDFDNQVLYDSITSRDDVYNLIGEYASFVNLRLKVNCRNTKNIGLGISLLTSVKIEKYLSSTIDGPKIVYICGSRGNIIEKITEQLDELIENKVNPTSITILSPLKKESSVISDKKLNKYNIVEYPDLDNKNITFSTIHSFKGMDNQIIFLVDIDDYTRKSLIYVGFSRARVRLTVFESQNATMGRINILKDGVKKL